VRSAPTKGQGLTTDFAARSKPAATAAAPQHAARPRGAVKKKGESDVHFPQLPKKVATCFILFFMLCFISPFFF
jgi:hypothetical protein